MIYLMVPFPVTSSDP